jgi:predicted lipid-binding transport protein (Tim44 family)
MLRSGVRARDGSMEAVGSTDARPVAVSGAALAAAMGLAALLVCGDASAAARGGLATSVSLVAMLMSVVPLAVFSSDPPASAALSAAGAVLLVAAGAGAWHRRSRQVADSVATSGAFAGSGVPLGSASARVAAPTLTTQFCEQFIRLQAAWDCAAMPDLRQLTTPRIFEDVCAELASRREVHGSNRTDVVTLRADVLSLEEFADLRLASVEFSGLIREAPEQGAVPFRELWILARSKHDESGWKLARQQTLL